MNLGIIARADKTGLGNQTRNLVRMLNPHRVLVIDSTPFNGNPQFFDVFDNYPTYIARGFPNDYEIEQFIQGLDAVLTCELFYNSNLVTIADKYGVRTYNQYNYEFLDHLVNPRLALPTKLISPSKWHLGEMQKRYGDRVIYLPPPTFAGDFNEVAEHNMSLPLGKPRFLHTVGRMAMNDRNGTLDLLNALQYTKEDFELVLKVQTGFNLPVNDPRVVVDRSSPNNEAELYRGFHALILPRRYAGLCLPMNEALLSGLPVIMTNVEPNNYVLPPEWLVDARIMGSFKARTNIELYSAYPDSIAQTIDWICANVKTSQWIIQQRHAHKIGYDNYSAEVLRPRYLEVIK